MSTTVTYKGNTIATLTNETRTLTTAGTWLDANISITDSSNSSSSVAASHTIQLIFSDNTNADIDVYYNDNFLNTIITNFTPSTYNGKNIKTAYLDGIAWYDNSWETIYEDSVRWFKDDNNTYPYCWISDLTDINIEVGSTWRITYNNTVYNLTGVADGNSGYAVIGNTKWNNGNVDNGIDAPFVFANYGWGAWTGSVNMPNEETTLYFKIERLTSV